MSGAASGGGGGGGRRQPGRNYANVSKSVWQAAAAANLDLCLHNPLIDPFPLALPLASK